MTMTVSTDELLFLPLHCWYLTTSRNNVNLWQLHEIVHLFVSIAIPGDRMDVLDHTLKWPLIREKKKD